MLVVPSQSGEDAGVCVCVGGWGGRGYCSLKLGKRGITIWKKKIPDCQTYVPFSLGIYARIFFNLINYFKQSFPCSSVFKLHASLLCFVAVRSCTLFTKMRLIT
ncbi:hypothetical protein POVWA2_057430 [Plasmodium ovale wallikeri]|uniref:Uncharacterized protein n=1 Tax=Plasmodium ovale wallikeri TaxID=864142 RepID=A0A1A8ZYS9_PLAOA|nr:hypothetical protein POVWA1_058080 [Plasmodium ovale wallikeri]SBT49043.1 hypothetical protein POVWA2_057430 [Plasmodium ovale wallikeri]